MANDPSRKEAEEGCKKEEKKKRQTRPRSQKMKGGHSAFGGLPSMEDARRVTSDSDSGVARSMGGCAVAPASQMLGGLPSGFGPPSLAPSMAPPSFAGAKMPAPPPTMFQPTQSKPPQKRSALSTASVGIHEHYGWKFAEVPTLPEHHPLEKSAVFVPHSDPLDVAKRVSEVLRERSIIAEYDDVKAKASCTTEEGVEFRVRLYRGRNKFSHGVIVEVQRRFGFSVYFHEDCNAVLDAAEGKVVAPPAPLPKFLPPVVVSDNDEDDDWDQPSPFSVAESGSKRKAAGSSSLDVAVNMLKRPKATVVNTGSLALGTLATITDPNRGFKAAALRVSRRILTDSPGDDPVRDAIVSLLVDRSFEIDGKTLDSDDSSMLELRLQAMTILCNAITVVSSSASPALLKSQDIFLTEDILPVLVDELREAKSNPRMAVVAARCLEVLTTCKAVGKEIAEAANETDAMRALRVANDEGQRGNVHLEEVTKRCIQALDSR